MQIFNSHRPILQPAGVTEFAMDVDEAGVKYPDICTTDEFGTEQCDPYSCTSLLCVDNSFDNMDNNIPEVGMSR